MPEYIQYIVPVIISSLAGILASWLTARSRNNRVGSQNSLDDMNTAKIALEISENSTKKQLEMEREIKTLNDILKNNHYRVTVVFRLGEVPNVESTTIESLQSMK